MSEEFHCDICCIEKILYKDSKGNCSNCGQPLPSHRSWSGECVCPHCQRRISVTLW